MEVFPLLEVVEQPAIQFTKLFAVEPRAVGTSFQESLPSYLNRLAMVHTVPVATLLSREIIPVFGSHEAPVSNYVARGSHMLIIGGGVATKVATSLAGLTATPSVASLIHPVLSQMLQSNRDMRTHSAWCPRCWEDWRAAGQPLYFPLLWGFGAVRCCVQHRERLVDVCPACGHQQWFLSGHGRLGECSYCRQSLLGSSPRVPPTTSELEVVVAMQALLQWSSQADPSGPPASMLVSNLQTAATAVGGGKPLARILGLSQCVVGFWLRGRQTPALNSLLRLRLAFGIPVEQWLSIALTPDQLGARPVPTIIGWLSSRRSPAKASDVEAALRRSLADNAEPPPSLVMLARTIPVTAPHLYRKFPDLASQIVARRRQYCANSKAMRAARNRALVQEAVNHIKASEMPVVASAVLKYLGPRWVLSRRRVQSVLAEVQGYCGVTA